MDYKIIDQRALTIVAKYKQAEAKLLDIIMQVDQYKVYRKLGYSSLFQYVVQRLRLTESQAYGFINVARKAIEVPEIKKSIEQGQLSVSKARRITSVVTKNNQSHWIPMAEEVTQRKLEREVALAQPNKTIQEKAIYISPEKVVPEKVQIKKNTPQVKLEVGISETIMLKLRRAQDLVSQKKRKAVNLEATLEQILIEYLGKHDPVEKAKRQKIKGGPSLKGSLGKNDDETIMRSKLKQSSRRVPLIPSKKRKAFPASLKHQVYLESDGRCIAIDETGKRCTSKRFLEIHHIQPLSKGGEDRLHNLILLCSGHHKVYHQY